MLSYPYHTNRRATVDSKKEKEIQKAAWQAAYRIARRLGATPRGVRLAADNAASDNPVLPG